MDGSSDDDNIINNNSNTTEDIITSGNGLPPSPTSDVMTEENNQPMLPPSPPSSPASSANNTNNYYQQSGGLPPSPPSSPPSSSASIDATPSATFRTPMSASVAHMITNNHLAHPESSRDTIASVASERSRLPRGDLGRSRVSLSVQTTNASSSQIHQEAPVSPTSDVTPALRRESSTLPDLADTTAEEDGDAPTDNIGGAVVWGTNVSVTDAMRLARRFLREYELPGGRDLDDMEESAYYLRVLAKMAMTQDYVMSIDCGHLISFRPSRSLYDQLISYPQVLIRVLDMVVAEEFTERHGEIPNGVTIQVRVFGLRNQSPMRDLDPSDIDQLVSIKGMVTRCSQVIPDLKEAFFQCTHCKQTQVVPLDRGRIEEPTICTHCDKRMTMEIVHNRCFFTDKQMVKMQETPDAIPEGETPHTVSLFSFDDLVDAVRPGDKVEVTGIFRAIPIRASSKFSVIKSVFKTYIDVIHFRVCDGSSSSSSNTDSQSDNDTMNVLEVDDENNIEDVEARKVAEFKALGSDPDIYSKLANSLAPSIWELDDIKKGVLCQLFGGTVKESSDPGARSFRGDINVLLCGDPGTSKSQLLSYVHRIAPRGIYTSGKGSSAVGLTASITRDPETRDLVLESGALVLSDRGICCIDEFDKMSDSSRAVLHEVMEQQTVSIAKAGIICSLNARASILASANPIESRYNPQKSVIENINILPTLLSRFDLIYLVIDRANAETDRRLAKHIVSLYFEKPTAPPPPLSMKMLSEYIAYAKKTVHPVLSNAAASDLIEGYLSMRSIGSNRKCITATPRQLESLIRLAEAHARIRLSSTVERGDVSEAMRLMNVATQRAAMDPRTGTIDMDMLTTGMSATDREATDALVEKMKVVLTNWSGKNLTISDLRNALQEDSENSDPNTFSESSPQSSSSVIKQTDMDAALRRLEEERMISLTNYSNIKILNVPT